MSDPSPEPVCAAPLFPGEQRPAAGRPHQDALRMLPLRSRDSFGPVRLGAGALEVPRKTDSTNEQRILPGHGCVTEMSVPPCARREEDIHLLHVAAGVYRPAFLPRLAGSRLMGELRVGNGCLIAFLGLAGQGRRRDDGGASTCRLGSAMVEPASSGMVSILPSSRIISAARCAVPRQATSKRSTQATSVGAT